MHYVRRLSENLRLAPASSRRRPPQQRVWTQEPKPRLVERPKQAEEGRHRQGAQQKEAFAGQRGRAGEK
jgi:hypothetical protein